MLGISRSRAAHRVLVVGVPRSGTSWVGSVLSKAPGAVYVNEPDTVGVGEGAAEAARTVGHRPLLSPHEDAPADYAALWDRHLSPRRRDGVRAVVVKSVKCHGTLDWISRRYEPSVVMVGADPVSIVSSWVAMEWFGGPMGREWFELRRPDLLEAAGGWPSDPIAQVALRVGTLAVMQEEVTARHPEWTVVRHEELCADPVGRFEALFGRVGLDFTDDVRSFVRATEAPGTGHDITRRAAAAQVRWQRLDAHDRQCVEGLLARLPLREKLAHSPV